MLMRLNQNYIQRNGFTFFNNGLNNNDISKTTRLFQKVDSISLLGYC